MHYCEARLPSGIKMIGLHILSYLMHLMKGILINQLVCPLS